MSKIESAHKLDTETPPGSGIRTSLDAYFRRRDMEKRYEWEGLKGRVGRQRMGMQDQRLILASENCVMV